VDFGGHAFPLEQRFVTGWRRNRATILKAAGEITNSRDNKTATRGAMSAMRRGTICRVNGYANTLEIVMVKIMLAAPVLATALLADCGAALAQRYTHYPVCAVYGWRTQSCAFMNFAQCQMSVSGGYCQANPFYEPPRGKRAAKRHRY
jgi:hypothetical protein